MERVLLAGQNGRESAIATVLADQQESELHIVSEFHSPTLVEKAEATGGRLYIVKDICKGQDLAKIAEESQTKVVWINQDNALESDVIGDITRRVPNILSASPDREGARIEFDKFDSRDIVTEIDKENGTSYNPQYWKVTNEEEAKNAIETLRLQGIKAVVKPRGLTGGKGVKVMGHHLESYEKALEYTKEVLANPKQGGVLIEEEIDGYEFTIQAPTDGKTLIVPPATYDYPFREDSEEGPGGGPGTGGMGCFTMAPGDKQLPFLSQDEYKEAIGLMEKVLVKLDERGRDYKGILYGSFFRTSEGLKLVEFNARIGCPEGMNIMELQEENTSLLNILKRTATRELRPNDMRFKNVASTVLNLVSPDYAYDDRPLKDYEFGLDPKIIASLGCRTYFAATEQVGHNRYRTVGSSRSLALGAVATTPWDARAKIHEAIKAGVDGPLEYRLQVGDHDFIQSLAIVAKP